MRSGLARGALGLAAALALGSPARSDPADGIRADALRAHVEFLASDLLEGRATGTRGHALAVGYARAALEAAGLAPAGTDGGWTQSVPFRRSRVVPSRSQLVLRGVGAERTLVYERDYLASDPMATTRGDVDASAVFVGFGITAPTLGHDDYAGLDVRGKWAVYLSGAPKGFPATLRAHYSGREQKLENAIAHGAIGILAVRTRTDEDRFPWAQVLIQVRNEKGSLDWVGPDGQPNQTFAALGARAVLSTAGAEQLFAGAPRPLAAVLDEADAGAPRGFALPVRPAMHVEAEHGELRSDNVAALLAGSDARLRDEVIVVSAHLDHMGIGEPQDGDAIYNGAVDNAAGVAALLEIARAATKLQPAPRRSVLFLGVTGEELGLLGSDYYAHFPTVGAKRLVGDVTLDGALLDYPPRDVVLYGEEHTTLGSLAHAAAAESGFLVSPDASPEQVYFIRSDQYSFVKRGIPAIFPGYGLTSRNPAIDGKAHFEGWFRTLYHTPKDDLAQPLDWQGSAQFAQFVFRLVAKAANADEAPRWLPGDFFGELAAERGN